MFNKWKMEGGKLLRLGTASLTLATIFLSAHFVQAETYTVQKGDSLSSIARSHNKTVDELSKRNKISNVNLIHVGQVLELDDTQAEPAAQTNSTVTGTSQTNSTNLSGDDAAAKEWIAQRESGGSYTAQNGQYYGRYQLTTSYLNGDLSSENQEKVADAYVAGRYGSWSAAKNFWLANGWY